MDRVVLLGGSDSLGQLLARLLLVRFPALELVIADESPARAGALAEALQAEYGQRVSGVSADASDEASLVDPLHLATLLITAAPVAEHTDTLARACVAAGVDVIDSHVDGRSWQAWFAQRHTFEAAGRTCIAQAGVHPGLAAPLLRAVREGFESDGLSLVSAMATHTPAAPAESLLEVVDVMADARMKTYRGGEWRAVEWSSAPTVHFGARFGKRSVFPLYLEELAGLPEELGASELASFVAGTNWLADHVVAPVIPMLYRIKRGLGRETAAKTLAWTSSRFDTEVADGCEIFAEARGRLDGEERRRRILLGSGDPWLLTAATVAACAAQLFDGSARRPGVARMADAVQGRPLFSELEAHGVELSREERAA